MRLTMQLGVALVLFLLLTGCDGSPATDSAADSATDSAAGRRADASVGQPGPSATDSLDAFVSRIASEHQANMYRQLLNKLSADAHDVESRFQMVQLMQTIGLAYMRDDDRPRAMRAFQISFETALPLPAELPQTHPNDAALLASVYYNGACVLASNGDIPASLEALDRAFQSGFTDFLLLDDDEDLARVRSAPAYAVHYRRWRDQAGARRMRRAQQELATGKSFPFDFDITDLAGNTHRLSDYRGNVLVVDVWGTWCPPCRAEIPSLIRLQTEFAEQGMQMLGLNYEGEAADPGKIVQQFVTDYGINYPCALGTPEIRDQIPNFEGFPTTLFIDRQGTVRLRAVGLHDYDYLASIVTELLAEKAQ